MLELTDAQRGLLAVIGAAPGLCTLEDLVESRPEYPPEALVSEVLALRDHGFVVPIQAWRVTAAGQSWLAGRPVGAEVQALPSSQDLLAAADGEIPADDPFVVVLNTVLMACTVGTWFDPDRIVTNAGSAGSDLLARIGINTEQLQDAMTDQLIRHVQSAVPHIAGYGGAVGRVVAAWRTGHWRHAPAPRRQALADACHRYDALIDADRHMPRPAPRCRHEQSPPSASLSLQDS